MAASPIIVTAGVRRFQRVLKTTAVGSPAVVRAVIKDALQPMVQTAIAQSPGTGKTIGSRWRATVRGATGALTNSHPGSRPWEFGGTIAPRGAPITFEAAHMIFGEGGAIEENKDEVERNLHVGFEGLVHRSGWK